ncbi:uncharacterized protein V1516DRAFT_683653 [Lipomyces oligophaga]|uniref:uncharacterized protein n=1 Tax=Lipomyces oligophaga TaxID=45792 RepID=UPI0034CE25B2
MALQPAEQHDATLAATTPSTELTSAAEGSSASIEIRRKQEQPAHGNHQLLKNSESRVDIDRGKINGAGADAVHDGLLASPASALEPRISVDAPSEGNRSNVSLYAPSTISPRSSKEGLQEVSMPIDLNPPPSPGLSSAISYDSVSFSPAQSIKSSSIMTASGPYASYSESILGNRGRRTSASSNTSILSQRRDLAAMGFNHGSMTSNAIASLLNSPSARASIWPPTTRDIPPIALPNINIVPTEKFQPFIDGTASEYDQYVRRRNAILSDIKELRQTKSSVPQRGDSLANLAATGTASTSFLDVLESRLLKVAINDGFSKDTITSPATTSASANRKKSVQGTPLSTIPSVYFEKNFNLENPRIFDVVTEKTDMHSTSMPLQSTDSTSSRPQLVRKSLANNAILQEKLSWYLDTVEVHLINEISKASPSFFAALGDLRNLHTETTNAINKISGLRQDLARVDREQAAVGLEIVRLEQRRVNVCKFEQAVAQMNLVSDLVTEAEDLWTQKDADRCWEKIKHVESAIRGDIDRVRLNSMQVKPTSNWKYELSNLSKVPAISAAQEKILFLKGRVINEYQVRFTKCLLDDIRRHVASVPTQETLDRLSRTYTNSKLNRSIDTPSGTPPPINNSYLILSEDLKPNVTKYLNLLEKVNSVESGVQRYRDAIMREVKNLIKRNLHSNVFDDDLSVSSGSTNRTATAAQLERMLREMRQHDFEDLLVSIFTGISELLRRLSVHQKLLLDITSSMDRIIDLSDLIGDAADITQARTVRIISVRRDIDSFPDQAAFASFYNVIRVFLAECEAITGRYGTKLLNAVMALKPVAPEPGNTYQGSRR